MSWFKTKKPPTKDELYVRDIVERMLDDKEVRKSIKPLSRAVYLENKKDNINVRIHYLNNRVDFCNSEFLYKKDISSSMTNMLVDKCAKKIEEELEEVDNLIYVEEIDLLRRILKKYDNVKTEEKQ